MLKATKIIISKHALERYQQRVSLKGTKDDIEKHIRRSVGASNKTLRSVRQRCPKHCHLINNKSNFLYLIGRGKGRCPADTIFVLKVISAGNFVFVTCWNLHNRNINERHSR